MTDSTTAIKPHTPFAKTLHWGFAAIYAYAIYKQVDGVEALAEPGLVRFEVVFAAAFLALLGFRYFYMRATRPTALPEDTAPMMKRLARLGHLGVYGSVALIAISGLCIGAVYTAGIHEGPVMDAVIFVHETAVMLSYVLIVVHVAAAIYHRTKGDGIWSSMVPVFREK